MIATVDHTPSLPRAFAKPTMNVEPKVKKKPIIVRNKLMSKIVFIVKQHSDLFIFVVRACVCLCPVRYFGTITIAINNIN